MIPRYIVDQCAPNAARENVRVLSTHIGMGVNPWVLLAIADRLVQDREHWEAFDPYKYFPASLHWAVSYLFPEQAPQRSSGNFAALLEQT